MTEINIKQMLNESIGAQLDSIAAYHRLGYRQIGKSFEFFGNHTDERETDDAFRSRVLRRLGF